MRSIEEIDEILEIIKERIFLANRTGNLDELLEKIGISECNNSFYETNPKGTIVVIGDSAVSKTDLLGIVKNLDLDKDRFEFCLNYEESKNYNYQKLKYESKYSMIMFGAIPHSSSGKGDYGSVVERLKNEIGFPKVCVLNNNDALKITKTNFRNALKENIEKGYI